MAWLKVDLEGLSKIHAGRDKIFALHELIANSFDAPGTTLVTVTLKSIPNRRARAELVVVDNSTYGFVDIDQSNTMYAESTKKSDPNARGRFNIGEKLVLALCDWAKIISVGAAIEFCEDRKTTKMIRERTQQGTRFEAVVRLTQEEVRAIDEQIGLLIPPTNIHLVYNGLAIRERVPVRTFTATLPTVKSDEDGVLRNTRRQTTVELFEPALGEEPTLFEMGIPVVASSTSFHVNVSQKIPLNADRDNVTPAYYRTVCAEVLNSAYDIIDKDKKSDTWVSAAIENPDVKPEAFESVLKARFGENYVSFDMHDAEANNAAVAAGYGVIHGRQLSGGAWQNARNFGSVQAAGRAFATPKPFSEDGEAARIIEPGEMTWAQREVLRITKIIAENILERSDIEVLLVDKLSHGGAAFGPDGIFYYSLKGLGSAWYEYIFTNPAKVWSLIIHELAHGKAHNHLSKEYFDECTEIGGLFTELARTQPDLLKYRRPTLVKA